MSDIEITMHEIVEGETAATLRTIYLEAFEPLRTRAATRHVLHEAEWTAMLNDPAFTKVIGRIDGDLRGGGIMTDQPEAVDWLSIDFLRSLYPSQIEARSLWYVVFVFVAPAAQRSPLFGALLETGTRFVPDGGVLLFDTCHYNGATVNIADIIAKEFDRQGADIDSQRPIDTQTFYGYVPHRNQP